MKARQFVDDGGSRKKKIGVVKMNGRVMVSWSLMLLLVLVVSSPVPAVIQGASNVLSPSNDQVLGKIPLNSLVEGIELDSSLIKNDENLQLGDGLKSPLVMASEGDAKAGTPRLPESIDVGKLFSDNTLDYQKVWEPWASKAGIHDIELSPDGEFLAIGGGFLYDNEIHIYRWNEELGEYVRAWESGDGVINSDIYAVDIGDTDNNQFLEVAAGSGDGYVYVFEQTHIFDPIARTETRFDPVWTSEYLGQVWGLQIADTDKDFVNDIVVGSWDGFIRWFEYSERSGYPFNREHWINYEESFRYPISGHIQSLQVVDLNYNGLPEVVVGTREGSLYIIENNGTVLDIGGTPFPLARDNNYDLIWSDEGSLWNPIMKLAAGNLDDDANDELVVVARGQGVYVLDYDSELGDFTLNKLTVPLESWETPTAGYPLDHHVDWMLNASVGNVLGGIDSRPEPADYSDRPEVYPYNTTLSQEPDGYYTKFDATSGPSAWAILDFGKDEAATGDGRVGSPTTLRGYDLTVWFAADTFPHPSDLVLSLSDDLEQWVQVPADSMTTANCTVGSACGLLVDIDSALNQKQLDGSRYLNLTVKSGYYYRIDAIHAKYLNRPLKSVLSAVIGTVRTSWDDNVDEANKIVMGTVDGRLIVYEYDNQKGLTTPIFDSFKDERYSLGGNIWDIVQVPSSLKTKIPTWKFVGDNIKSTSLVTDFSRLNSMNWAKYHVDSDNIGASHDLVVGYDNNIWVLRGDTLTYSSTLTNAYFLGINFYLDAVYPNTLVSIAVPLDVLNADGIPIVAALGILDPATTYSPDDPTQLASARILFVNIFSGLMKDLSNLEVSGQLRSVLEQSQVVPTMAFGDVNGDGSEDLVVANGKFYLVKTVGGSWMLDREYFKDLNRQTSQVFTNPQLVDLDKDGDLDLIVSYVDRNGLAYWVNEGDAKNPLWKLHKQDLINLNPSTNLAYNNLTMFAIEHGSSLNETLQLSALNRETLNVHLFEADSETHDSFIVGINPKLARIDVNIRSGKDSSGTIIKNFGYRILETWNTEKELEQWTQSIIPADLDGDGKRELVVGDFDNNIYVFEHLSNNTYKRAYRSLDLSQKLNTSESPYAADQLQGIQVSVTRFQWQHVDFVAGPFDGDGDGKLEFVAVANFVIYVFEQTGRDDSYELIWTTDFASTPWKQIFDFLGIEHFNSLEVSRDMNYNFYDEFLLAAGPFLFIFEGYADNLYKEIFMDSALRQFLPGSHYILPENGLLYYYVTFDGSFQLEITDIQVGDFIKDTPEQEIAIIGINRTAWGQQHGFGFIMRNVGSSFTHLASFPNELTFLNPLYSLKIDDQDYDGNPEFIIGHSHGTDVWEIRLTGIQDTDPSKVFELVRMARISSSPVYSGLKEAGSLFDSPFEKYPIDTTRSTDIIVLDQSIGTPGTQGYLARNTIVQVYAGNGRLQWSISTNNGSSWDYQGYLFPNKTYDGTRSILFEREPSLYQHSNGDLYLGWQALNAGGSYTTIELAKYDSLFGRWEWIDVLANSFSTSLIYEQVSLFTYPYGPNDDRIIGFTIFELTQSTITLNYYDLATGNVNTFGGGSVPFIGITGSDSHQAFSMDFLYQDHGVGNGSFILAFSGKKFSESRLDLDIWISLANVSSQASDPLTWTLPVRVTTESTSESYPDLTQLKTVEGTVMVVYEIQGGSPQGEIGISYSTSGGLTWNMPERLNTLPSYIRYRFFPVLGLSLPTLSTNPNIVLPNLQVRSPTIAALPWGGFIDSYTVSYDAYLLEQIPISEEQLAELAEMYGTTSLYQYRLTSITDPSVIATYYNDLSGVSGRYENVSYASTFSLGYALLQTLISNGATDSSSIISTYFQGILETNLSMAVQVTGTYRNIMVDVNPSEGWSQLGMTSGKRVEVGDTDGDGLREIVIASDYQVYLVEISHSSPKGFTYRQAWKTDIFEEKITDIAMYDANGNGFEEIFVSAEKGNVYAFEAMMLDLKPINLQFINENLMANASWNAVDAQKGYEVLAAFDADGNGIDEVITADLGVGGSQLKIYPNGDFANPISLNLNGFVTQLARGDVNADNVLDLAYGTDQGEYGIIDMLQTLSTGVISHLRENAVISGDVRALEFVDYLGIGEWALFVMTNQTAALTETQGTSIFWSLGAKDLGNASFFDATVGHFLNETSEDLVLVNSKSVIHVVQASSGAIVNNITTYSTTSDLHPSLSSLDLDDDGFDDIILATINQNDGKSILYAIDGGTQQKMLWNYTDFLVDEQVKDVKPFHDATDDTAHVIVISDSLFGTDVNRVIRENFDSIAVGTIQELPEAKVSGVKVSSLGTLTFTVPGILIPLTGGNALLSSDLVSQINFTSMVKTMSFFLTANSSANVKISVYSETGVRHDVLVDQDLYRRKFVFDSDSLGFKGLKRLEITTSKAATWYLDDLEYGILEPLSVMRNLDSHGELSWQSSIKVSQLPKVAIDESNGLAPQVLTMGLSTMSNETTQFPLRGLVILDLSNGKVNAFGSITTNVHGGVMGTISQQGYDGVYLTEDGELHAFHFVNQLSSQTLSSVTMSPSPQQQYQLGSSVNHMSTANVNGDGIKDLYVTEEDGNLYALDGRNLDSVLWKVEVPSSPVSLTVGNFVGKSSDDALLTFENGTFSAIDGDTGQFQWSKVLLLNHPYMALNVGDQDSDGYDDLLIATFLRQTSNFSISSMGNLILVSGQNGTILDQVMVSGIVHQILLARDGTIVVNFLNGIGVFRVNATSSTPFLVKIDQLDMAFQRVIITTGTDSAGAGDGLLGVTKNNVIIFYKALKDLSAITWSYDLSLDVGMRTAPVHGMVSLDSDSDDIDDQVVIGVLGMGYLSYDLELTSSPTGVNWVFRDSSARSMPSGLSESSMVLHESSSSQEFNLLLKNGDLVYLLSLNGVLSWMTSLSLITGDVTSFISETIDPSIGEEIIIGTELGMVLRFDPRNATSLAQKPTYVPWWQRYQKIPVTPQSSASLTTNLDVLALKSEALGESSIQGHDRQEGKGNVLVQSDSIRTRPQQSLKPSSYWNGALSIFDVFLAILSSEKVRKAAIFMMRVD